MKGWRVGKKLGRKEGVGSWVSNCKIEHANDLPVGLVCIQKLTVYTVFSLIRTL